MRVLHLLRDHQLLQLRRQLLLHTVWCEAVRQPTAAADPSAGCSGSRRPWHVPGLGDLGCPASIYKYWPGRCTRREALTRGRCPPHVDVVLSVRWIKYECFGYNLRPSHERVSVGSSVCVRVRCACQSCLYGFLVQLQPETFTRAGQRREQHLPDSAG